MSPISAKAGRRPEDAGLNMKRPRPTGWRSFTKNKGKGKQNEQEFVKRCKKAVTDYANAHLDKADHKQITEADVLGVWQCKVLLNNKALLNTTCLMVCTMSVHTTAIRRNCTSMPTKSGKSAALRFLDNCNI